MNHEDLWNKTLKNLKQKYVIASKEDAAHLEGYNEAIRDFRKMGTDWAKAFEKGECHTDFAADGRNGQENIIEWIEHVFEIKPRS